MFAPFCYSGLFSEPWDLLLIEGWTGPLPAVIYSLRSRLPRLIVLHWVLDTYPDLATLTKLDVDGFMTNSRVSMPTLGFVPVLYLPLAADTQGDYR